MEMKKNRVAIASLILVMLIVVFGVTGCGTTSKVCDHDWKDATCTRSAYCSKCGITDGEALGHRWDEATCTSASICSVCGASDGKPLGHVVSEYDVILEAQCTTEGVKKGICVVCGDEITERDPATGEHEFSEWNITCHLFHRWQARAYLCALWRNVF